MSSADHGLTPAEQHLGDRLAALVDGELGHDARERVLSHLATCGSCRAEADAQRQLKSVFADSAPPPPSDGLLARLQGLPACSDPGSGSGLGPGFGAEELGTPPLGREEPGGDRSGRSPLSFAYLSGGRGPSALMPERGFRIHRVPDAQRPPSRGRRFAFVAAGAFSLAALALSGALNSGTGGTPVAAGERGSPPAGQARTAAPSSTAPAPAAAERDFRRRAAGEESGRRAGSPAPAPAASNSLRTQLLAGMPAPTRVHPLLGGSSPFTPSLIRPPSVLSRALSAEQRTPLGAIPGRTPAAVPASPTPTSSPAAASAAAPGP
ncbi:zf-HC2 domain-containing protein [Streptomyces sp. N2-109]|uniref:Zf-HC2 domain-containing protein n=1 Tax=Streptomyces gossypii TaxID=2883101 RepID=A0ABT2JVI8_9ACTN|nr:zf-HC2 domain-containing protein [Streptomyces gossypii]MCT2591917.1 zf-HC2 domain-containing protein [Streptomyces gossypii]